MTIEGFFNFIYQRQAIWHSRQFGLKYPWSEDDVLNKYKFCNIYRELDKCSIHLIDWVINNEELSLEDKIFNMLLYRRFNTPDFFSHYGVQRIKTFDKDLLINKMDEMKASGVNLFNSAYIICQVSFESDYRKSDKHVQQILLIEKHAPRACSSLKFDMPPGLEYVCKCLKSWLPLTGDFLSYQYAIDISYLKEYQNRFKDFNSWCDAGPGTIQAINELFGNQKNAKKYSDSCFELFKMQNQYLKEDWKRIAYDSPYNPKPILSLNNIENSLCEYRKWNNLSNGIGRKRYYHDKG